MISISVHSCLVFSLKGSHDIICLSRDCFNMTGALQPKGFQNVCSRMAS